MTLRWVPRALAVLLLLLAVGWCLRWSARVRGGAELAPAELLLRPGEHGEVRLVNYEPEIMAFSFRLRFDETVVQIDAPPEEATLLAGDEAVHMPVRRSPGLLEVQGVALAGGRWFKPLATLYQFPVRGIRPGTATLAVEDLTLVDLSGERRMVPERAARITVSGP